MGIKEQYLQVRKDWETLWNIAPADDMTGGYVDQNDLDELLKNPTKKTATKCMTRQIHHWFTAGPDSVECKTLELGSVDDIIASREEVREVAERYGYA